MVVGKSIIPRERESEEVFGLAELALSQLSFDGKRVLVIVPDTTRHARLPLFYKLLYTILGPRVRSLDVLVATGTHRPMEMERIHAHLGMSGDEHRSAYTKTKFYNHAHDDPKQLRVIGTISASEMSTLSQGLFNEPVDITVNKRIFQYDHLILLSPVVPHETVGFSGGNKYFFPGIGGSEIIQTFHWIGALITNPVVNGVKDTLVRRVIDRSAQFVHVPTLCFAYVVDEHAVASLFIGSPEESWSLAADCSMKAHIKYVDHPYKRVLGIAPSIYEDIWVAGKVMYKHEPIIADGGEVIIYAPHITELSYTHGNAIKKIGYHVRDYFVKQWDRFSKMPKLILAHSTNVRGIGSFENGVEVPRIKVTLATAIPKEVCNGVNLDYVDPRDVDIAQWKDRQNGDELVVENAGQLLYRLKG